jgi:HEAT repeat protein
MTMAYSEAFFDKWVEYLHRAPDRELSIKAAHRLAETKDPRVVPELIQALRGRPDDVRAAAVRALGEMGDKAAAPALIPILDDPNVLVSSAAADALGLIRATSAVPPLIEILKNYKSGKSHHDQIHGYDRGLFMAAVFALQRINTPEARKALDLYNR